MTSPMRMKNVGLRLTVALALGATGLVTAGACGGGESASPGASGEGGAGANGPGSGGSTGTPGQSGAAGTGGSGGSGPSGTPCTPTGAPDEPDDAFADTNCDALDGDRDAAIFVDGEAGADEGDEAALGTPGRPVKTIGRGLELARERRKGALYVCAGSYAENVELDGASGPMVSLYGGYECADLQQPWRRSAEQKTVIAPASGVPLTIRDSAQPVTVDRVDLTAPDASGDGASSYALMITGASFVRVRHAAIVAGKGADGAPGGAGEAGGLLACDGLNGCSVGDATPGGPGGVGAPGEPGTFGEGGYVPGSGGDGGDGQSGSNGKEAAPPQPVTYRTCTQSSTACHEVDTYASGEKGLCGCGSRGGRGGRAGRGGGASVGVYVVAKAGGEAVNLALEASAVTARRGGAGEVGGLGGDGGQGSQGVKGESLTYWPAYCEAINDCTQSVNDCPLCCNPLVACVADTESQAPGTSGGNGAPSGAGGKGGGGSGGPSFALVTVGGVEVQTPGTSFAYDAGGPGADGAPSGDAGKHLAR